MQRTCSVNLNIFEQILLMCGFVSSLCTNCAIGLKSIIHFLLQDMSRIIIVTRFFKFIVHSMKFIQTAGAIETGNSKDWVEIG